LGITCVLFKSDGGFGIRLTCMIHPEIYVIPITCCMGSG
jgi:hypothetical protein